MSTWSEFRSTVGLPKGKTPWAVLCTALVLLSAGWLLQERVTAPSLDDLDYSDLCRFIDQGKVELVVLKGQAAEGDFFELQQVAGHQTKVFRATVPSNDPSFWPLLQAKKVRVRVIAAGPGLLTRLALGAVPMALFFALGLWASHRARNGNPGLPVSGR